MTEITEQARRLRDKPRARARMRANYAEKKKRGEKRAAPKLTEEQRNRYNENRRAKAERSKSAAPTELRRGFGIVSRSNLNRDITKWRGPGWLREERLTRQADEILNAAKGAAENAGTDDPGPDHKAGKQCALVGSEV